MTALNNNQKKIQLVKVIAKNLLFRGSADELFNQINNFEISEIIIDFQQIQSITRSFAQQYLKNKEQSKKKIIDVNITPTIKKMFELIGKANKS